MEERNRSSLAAGILLIALGAYLLLVRMIPGLSQWIGARFEWPVWVIGAGLLLLTAGLLTGKTDLAVPAMIVAGVGLILLWQWRTGRWDSWLYAWTLIPGFAGLGELVSGVVGGSSKSRQEGIRSILVSLALFVVVGSILGPLGNLGVVWPVLVILIGVYLLVRQLFPR